MESNEHLFSIAFRSMVKGYELSMHSVAYHYRNGKGVEKDATLAACLCMLSVSLCNSYCRLETGAAEPPEKDEVLSTVVDVVCTRKKASPSDREHAVEWLSSRPPKTVEFLVRK
jgi:hypothetical protein